MRERYLRIMERALEAYTPEHIREYLDSVREKGLTEHGFPRLTANIGILMAHGKRTELLPVFLEMMDLCCFQMPGRHAANDFSVKEICFALLELEQTSLIPLERMQAWKEDLRRLDAWQDYDCIAPTPDTRVGNWAAYGAASEYLREVTGQSDASAFLDRQIPSQLLSVEENGMYRDPNDPILYDLATRCQFAVLLHFGYSGQYRDALDDCLKKSGMLTLQMQSVTGEMAFGGRSNQYLFNEAYLASACAYEAARYAGEGDMTLAGQFQDAAAMAADSILLWLDRLEGKRHIKNRYPMDSSYGCEGYGYFDKYMISLASFIYLAYLFTAVTVLPVPCPARCGGYTARTSVHFHKFAANCGGYFLEWDTAADPHYDATGLGRIHKAGAPSELMLSVPFAEKPVYRIRDGKPADHFCGQTFADPDRNPGQLAMCGGVLQEEKWHFACEEGDIRDIRSISESDTQVTVELVNSLGQTERYDITADGIEIIVTGKGRIAYALPLFAHNGQDGSFLEYMDELCETVVCYDGWLYRITTTDTLKDTKQDYRNRNGTYTLFLAEGTDTLKIRLCCEKDTGIREAEYAEHFTGH
ncbi:MAG: hypothetical protein IJB52_09400 [Clostridia bacterium]|nr:hypothetical protein [Clostridia bacterium]